MINAVDKVDGQLSIWDIESINKENKAAENKQIKVEELYEGIKVPQKQCQRVHSLDGYDKYISKGNVTRIIKHCGGGSLIETYNFNGGYSSIYVNKLGNEEFSFNKQAPVLPMDEVIFYDGAEIVNTSIQEEVLEKIQGSFDNIEKAIRRRGDYNLLIKAGNKLISILQDGKVLEFNNLEILEGEAHENSINNIESLDNVQNDLKELQRSVKIGHIVEDHLGTSNIIGCITHVYGNYNESLCISFDNETKSTAIPRILVQKILGSKEVRHAINYEENLY